MSFTCQAPPDETTVTAYWLDGVRGRLRGGDLLADRDHERDRAGLAPNERIESIVPLPVDTCLSAARGPATPAVL